MMMMNGMTTPPRCRWIVPVGVAAPQTGISASRQSMGVGELPLGLRHARDRRLVRLYSTWCPVVPRTMTVEKVGSFAHGGTAPDSANLSISAELHPRDPINQSSTPNQFHKPESSHRFLVMRRRARMGSRSRGGETCFSKASLSCAAALTEAGHGITIILGHGDADHGITIWNTANVPNGAPTFLAVGCCGLDNRVLR